MSANRYETKVVKTQDPDGTIASERRLGWHVVGHGSHSEVVASSHEGGSMAIGGGNTLYGGTTRYRSRTWYTLRFQRDTQHPNYPLLLEALQRTPAQPRHPKKPGLGALLVAVVFGWIPFFLAFYVLLLPLRLIPAVNRWAENPGPTGLGLIGLCCLLTDVLCVAGVWIGRKEHPDKMDEYHRASAEYNAAWGRVHHLGEQM